MSTVPVNLDHRAAQEAQAIINNWIAGGSGGDAKMLENVIRRTLGTLQENGPFATALFLLTRGQKETAAATATLNALLSAAASVTDVAIGSSRPLDILGFMTASVTSSLDRLILVTGLWEQILIYARYAASAIQ